MLLSIAPFWLWTVLVGDKTGIESSSSCLAIEKQQAAYFWIEHLEILKQ